MINPKFKPGDFIKSLYGKYLITNIREYRKHSMLVDYYVLQEYAYHKLQGKHCSNQILYYNEYSLMFPADKMNENF